MPLISELILYFLALYVFVAAFLYLFQEIIIFPRLIESKLSKPERNIPSDIESFFAETADHEKIEVWTTHPKNEKAEYAAIIFHGNGETVEARNFMGFFSALGIRSFTLDYRGTGLSSGWPSEKGLYLDAEAVYNAVIERTGLSADKIIILGNSLGSGPASYLASKIHPLGLILLSAYSSMRLVAKRNRFYKFFWYVSRYSLPTAEFVSRLKSSFLILAHGKLDQTIKFEHLALIREKIPPGLKLKVFESDASGHKDLYDNIEKQLINAVSGFIR